MKNLLYMQNKNSIKNILYAIFNGKNIVNNGNFATDSNSDGLADNWVSTTGGGAFTQQIMSNNIQSFTVMQQYNSMSQNITFIGNHNYYVSASICSADTNTKVEVIGNDGNSMAQEVLSITNIFQKVSFLLTATNVSGTLGRIGFLNLASSNWQPIQVKEVMVIDLTSIFGANNKPTGDWCNENIPFIV